MRSTVLFHCAVTQHDTDQKDAVAGFYMSQRKQLLAFTIPGWLHDIEDGWLMDQNRLNCKKMGKDVV